MLLLCRASSEKQGSADTTNEIDLTKAQDMDLKFY